MRRKSEYGTAWVRQVLYTKWSKNKMRERESERNRVRYGGKEKRKT